VGFEYREPPSDSNTQKQPASEARASFDRSRANIPPVYSYNSSNQPDNNSIQPTQPAAFPDLSRYQEPSYREHVSGNLVLDPAEAPRFRPVYPTYPNYYPHPPQSYPPPAEPRANQPVQQVHVNQPPMNGYAPQYYYPYAGYPGYYGYGGYGYAPYPWQPVKPARDGYLLGISIAAFICSLLVVLGGFICIFILAFILLSPERSTMSEKVFFSGVVMFIALSMAFLSGGCFSLYHSIRSLFLKKPSATFKLPGFWLFLALYIGVAAIGIILDIDNASISNIPFTIFLIALSGIFPALTILALGMRRVTRRIDNGKRRTWPTTWRRFTLAIVSGATSAILLASFFELILTAFIGQQLGISGFSLDNPGPSVLQNPRTITFMILLLSVIAPLVEEGVKPLAALALIGRIGSAAEAFVLGLACGIGFDIIETSGYISQGYQNWLKVALERSPSGLLHGFGAAMVTLGWYYLTHKQSARHRFLLGSGCILYAIVQHAIWNGTFILALLPAPFGPFFDHGTVPLGPLSFGGDLVPYIVLTLFMLVFFVYVTGKIKTDRQSTKQPPQPQPPLHNQIYYGPALSRVGH
jgi:RsiW-degrading membrane proteinase PrsW (M82 family)